MKKGCISPDCNGKDKGSDLCPVPVIDCKDPENKNLPICLDCKGKDK